MSRFIEIEQIARGTLPVSGLVVYGGTFDPIHQGHLGVIKDLVSCFLKVMVAPTNKNPWKMDAPDPTPIELRREMIRLLLSDEDLVVEQDSKPCNISVCEYDYSYVDELVPMLRKTSDLELFWAVGQDIVGSVPGWRNFSNLNLTFVIAPIVLPIHAESIRLGKNPLHPSLIDFCKRHRLYSFRK